MLGTSHSLGGAAKTRRDLSLDSDAPGPPSLTLCQGRSCSCQFPSSPTFPRFPLEMQEWGPLHSASHSAPRPGPEPASLLNLTVLPSLRSALDFGMSSLCMECGDLWGLCVMVEPCKLYRTDSHTDNPRSRRANEFCPVAEQLTFCHRKSQFCACWKFSIPLFCIFF